MNIFRALCSTWLVLFVRLVQGLAFLSDRCIMSPSAENKATVDVTFLYTGNAKKHLELEFSLKSAQRTFKQIII